MVAAKRCIQNPLILPKDVKPSREEFQVDGVFNCGVIKYQDEIILLCRVAESVKKSEKEKQQKNRIKIPIIKEKDGKIKVDIILMDKKDYPSYDFSDSRSIWIHQEKGQKIKYLTSLSHFRIARSKDGVHFTISDTPDIFPEYKKAWGIEDPRITQIEDTYYITYTAVSQHGAAAALMTTKDFRVFSRKGIIFAPENKDVVIFPEKINGFYYALNRPVPSAIGTPDMWLARSANLIHWGEQRHFLGINKNCSWVNGRIGSGAVPIKTESGWLIIYHAADKKNRYCLGAMLLSLKQPEKILSMLSEPILSPETEYEKKGFFGEVVFTCGAVLESDNLSVYYGAADDKICRADYSLKNLLEELEINKF